MLDVLDDKISFLEEKAKSQIDNSIQLSTFKKNASQDSLSLDGVEAKAESRLHTLQNMKKIVSNSQGSYDPSEIRRNPIKREQFQKSNSILKSISDVVDQITKLISSPLKSMKSFFKKYSNDEREISKLEKQVERDREAMYNSKKHRLNLLKQLKKLNTQLATATDPKEIQRSKKYISIIKKNLKTNKKLMEGLQSVDEQVKSRLTQLLKKRVTP